MRRKHTSSLCVLPKSLLRVQLTNYVLLRLYVVVVLVPIYVLAVAVAAAVVGLKAVAENYAAQSEIKHMRRFVELGAFNIENAYAQC